MGNDSDGLLAPRYHFAPISWQSAVEAFARVHALSERVYWGGGRWGADRCTRESARRAIGYLAAAQVTGEQIYRERGLEAVEFLASRQQVEGHWLWYGPSFSGLGGGDFDYYETGIAGVAMLEAYAATADPAWLDASHRAARYLVRLPISPNNNYNMFGAWQLARHYAVEPNPMWLEAAIYRTYYGGMPGQLPSGGWPGHNASIWYHSIILRGMAQLWLVLPEGHPFRGVLRPAFVAALNRLAREMEPSGRVPPLPDDRRHTHRNAFCICATLLAEDALGPSVRPITDGLANYRIAQLPAVPNDGARPVGDPDARGSDGEEVFRPTLDRFVHDPTWGDVPLGWHNVWIPLQDPPPGLVHWACDDVLAGPGPSLAYWLTDTHGQRGVGFDIPPGVLVPGGRYRLRARVAGLENWEARGCLDSIWVSVYAGDPRPTWDAQSDCTVSNETADVGFFRDVTVDFTAGVCNVACFLPMGQVPRPGGRYGLLVRDVRIVAHRSGPPNQIPDPVLRSLDTEIMAFGLYLKHRHGDA